MARKFKLTGFARFFIAMLFIAPAAYIGASYLNNEDGIENIKNLIGIGDKKEQVIDQEQHEEHSEEESSQGTEHHEGAEHQANADLLKRVEKLESEIQDLRKTIEAKDKEIKHLKQQLEQTE